MNSKEVEEVINNSVIAFRELLNEYKSCKLELCRLCQRQKIFTNDWCKECRWSDINNK